MNLILLLSGLFMFVGGLATGSDTIVILGWATLMAVFIAFKIFMYSKQLVDVLEVILKGMNAFITLSKRQD